MRCPVVEVTNNRGQRTNTSNIRNGCFLIQAFKQSLLQKAFSGELAAAKATTEAILKEEEIA